MIESKCYYVTGLFRYYRTLGGKTFSVRDNEAYFYHGNVYKNQDILVYIKDAEKLKKNVKFVDQNFWRCIYMKMLMLDVVNKDVKMVEANGLADYYKLIGSDQVDIIHR